MHLTTPLAQTYTKRQNIRLMLLSNRYGSLAKHLYLYNVDGHMQSIMLYKSKRTMLGGVQFTL